MKTVILLPPDVSRKIAAGEVIERPFSVVKELVENSLDAGADSISIELERGGKSLIRVSDDGCGLSREDAVLSFERHSTSKLRTEDDLERIATLGFRGEALPSIAAVSVLTMKTADGSEAAGTIVVRRPDAAPEIRDAAHPRGTSVEVRDLFFNLPARRKFLRSEASELNQIVRFVRTAALAHPEVGFVLSHGRREILRWPPAGSPRDRLFQALGGDAADRLIEVDFTEGESRLTGFVSRPPLGRGDRSEQHFFVNRRPVKDRLLTAALNQAFRGLLEKNLHPEAFLFLSHPLHEVDVNVHPAKAEIRFLDSQTVFRLVVRAIESAAAAAGGVKRLEIPSSGAETESGPASFRQTRPPIASSRGAGVREPDSSGALFPEAPGDSPRRRRVLGQFLETYIIAADEEGLQIIDQHNAHERILFERFKEIRASGSLPRRQALIPILFDLPPDRALRVEENAALIEETGFRVEPMGGRTFSLREFPDVMAVEEALRVFQSLLEELGEGSADEKQDRVLALLACRAAIKAGQPLTMEKMEVLVEELFRLPQHALCPHRRPLLVRIDRSEIEKGMKRPSN
ncbi:MAG: DNA mismatch repair endonuclease MutL [Candidatus Aminicenantes bacterium]|nr:DNA mismatch repair endonuclease MutL [Candidatus Aminicenantes bacterium]